MNRTSTRTSGDRIAMTLSRSIVSTINDSPFMQVLGIKIRGQETSSDVEHWHPAGLTHYPVEPNDKGAAEVILATLTGNNSHPIAMPAADRRFRPNGMRQGDTALHDAFKQFLHFSKQAAVLESPARFVFRVAAPAGQDQARNQGASLAAEKSDKVTVSAKADGTLATTSKDATTVTGKSVAVTAGTRPEAPGNHELNQQLKGLAARLAQAEHHIAGVFDVTSQFRAIVQTVIPAVAAVAPILNQNPSGLKLSADAIAGTAQSYLQAQVQQALQKFLAPNLAGLASVLGGGVEGLIAGAQAQIAALIASNPVAARVDGLLARIEALADAPLPTDTAAAAIAMLQAQVDYLARENPVVGQIAQVRGALQGLIDGAGPGLGFLGPQQRLVQGLTRSMLFSKGG